MSDSSALPPIPADIGRVAGPLLIGHLLHWGFFGVLSMQVYMYYLAFPNDSGRIRLLVGGVYLFETAQIFILTQSAFRAFAEGFGNLLILDQIGTIWFSVPIMGGIVAFAVQSFYAYRVSVLSKSIVVACFIMLLAFVQLGGAIATGIESKRAVLNSRFLGTSSFITLGIWNGGSAVCDGIIAICMTVYLLRRKTNVKRTAAVVDRIVRLTIETGTFTAVIAILNLVLSLLPGHPTYYMGVVGILGKVYSNSMMVSLNSRMNIAPDINSTTVGGPHATDGTYSKARSATAYEMNGGISVTQEQVSFTPAGHWKSGQIADLDRYDVKGGMM